MGDPGVGVLLAFYDKIDLDGFVLCEIVPGGGCASTVSRSGGPLAPGPSCRCSSWEWWRNTDYRTERCRKAATGHHRRLAQAG